MKKVAILIVFFVLGLSYVLPTYASEAPDQSTTPSASLDDRQEEGLYRPILLPTSPFYFLKQWKERIEIALSDSLREMVESRLEIATRRLAETKALSAENPEMASRILTQYQEQIALLENELENMPVEEKDAMVSHVAAILLKHQSVLLDILSGSSGGLKIGLENALEKSLSSYQHATSSDTIESSLEERKENGEKIEKVIDKLERVETIFNDDDESENKERGIRIFDRLKDELEDRLGGEAGDNIEIIEEQESSQGAEAKARVEIRRESGGVIIENSAEAVVNSGGNRQDVRQ